MYILHIVLFEHMLMCTITHTLCVSCCYVQLITVSVSKYFMCVLLSALSHRIGALEIYVIINYIIMIWTSVAKII